MSLALSGAGIGIGVGAGAIGSSDGTLVMATLAASADEKSHVASTSKMHVCSTKPERPSHASSAWRGLMSQSALSAGRLVSRSKMSMTSLELSPSGEGGRAKREGLEGWLVHWFVCSFIHSSIYPLFSSLSHTSPNHIITSPHRVEARHSLSSLSLSLSDFRFLTESWRSARARRAR